MTDKINQITLDDQQLRAIIWCMNKLDSEYLAHGNNGCYLDQYEKKLLKRLKKIQELRNKVRFEDGITSNLVTELSQT